MAKIEIPRSLLHRLYVEEGLTTVEIGERWGCSEQTVRRRLTEHDIPIRPRGPRTHGRVSHKWSADLAYAIGLITADGNLSPDGRHITFVSADRELHETYRRCLGISNRTGQHTGGYGSAFKTTFGDVVFYHWLLGIGLMPDKTFRLRRVDVPDEYFADFTRGFLDGDGNINVYLDSYNVRKHRNEKYAYWRLYVRLYSASRPFLEWMQAMLVRLVSAGGTILDRGTSGWVLQYAKRDSLHLLPWVYYSPGVPCLERKRARFYEYLVKVGLTGWSPWCILISLVDAMFRALSATPPDQAGVSEQVDDLLSKSSGLVPVWVRIPPPAPRNYTHLL